MPCLLPPHQPHGQDRAGQHDERHHQQHRRRVAELLEPEERVVAVDRDQLRGRARAAVRQHVDLVERGESVDRAQHDRDGEHGRSIGSV